MRAVGSSNESAACVDEQIDENSSLFFFPRPTFALPTQTSPAMAALIMILFDASSP